jgi:hypothetical protein
MTHQQTVNDGFELDKDETFHTVPEIFAMSVGSRP